jgi:signal transduction histidine kinase
MSAAFTVNCEGEGDQLITEVIRLVTEEINTTVTVTVPTTWWCSYLVNAIAAGVPTRTDDATFVDVEFHVSNQAEGSFMDQFNELSDDDIRDMMEDFLDELEDDSEDEDNNND